MITIALRDEMCASFTFRRENRYKGRRVGRRRELEKGRLQDEE